MLNFKDKVSIVTGGGSGIGRSLALALAKKGAKVIITDIFQDRVDEVVSELKELGVPAGGYVVDHSKLDSVEKFKKEFLNDWDHVDIMCLNAGVGGGGRIEELTMADWQWLLSINLWGAIYMTQLFVPTMIERQSGSVLITASGLGLFGAPAMAPYTTSKFAMVGLAESLRMELGAHNIKVSSLCPGIIDTKIVSDGKIYVNDEEGVSAKGKVSEFYKSWGTSPDVVAKDGLKALAKDIGIMPTPYHTWPMYLLRRFSPGLYQSIVRYVFKKGWIL
jgi:NAD(P)-dependent dehydrogenase (short-subunit alcohol dehydrogenase family)